VVNQALRVFWSAVFLSLASVMLLGVPRAALALPVEVHDVLAPALANDTKEVALTLDACSGRFDDELITFLIQHRIPATLFVTERWIQANAEGVAIIKAHLDQFDVEDHGANHIPAVIGVGRKVYGIPGEPDMIHLRQEVQEGARAIELAFGVHPRWYRGATAEYDVEAEREIERMGYGIAGFSVNADQGATLPKPVIEARLHHVRDGDIIIAHMNKPASDSAEALSDALPGMLRQGIQFVTLRGRAVETLAEANARS
jgi:peptidoglycan/xylan/chitin deacetylase (PgdA/CDA1 family)